MRKIEIVEIENSYLNFFTPAVLVAVGYFLFNLIAWPFFFYQLEILLPNLQTDSSLLLLKYILPNISYTILLAIIFFVIIPRLKVKYTEYKKANVHGIAIVLVFFCIVTTFQAILFGLIEFFDLEVDKELFYGAPWFVGNWTELENPVLMSLFLIFKLVMNPLFLELIYRRLMIPLLEDRGLSPFHAVILASLGDSFISIPHYLLRPNPDFVRDSFAFLLSFVFGIFAGLIYIWTRNILFPFILGALFSLHNEVIAEIGVVMNDATLLVADDLIIGISFIITFGIIFYLVVDLMRNQFSLEWFKTLKKPSAPYIKKGVVGFFIISLGLLLIQAIVAKIGRELTGGLPDYFYYIMIFYVIAFSVPFWLSIQTEFAQSGYE